jgi:L-fuconate dehydratase
MKNRAVEYVDHLHEHFLHPVTIRRAHYMLPEEPGYSIDILQESLEDYRFPDGSVWRSDA